MKQYNVSNDVAYNPATMNITKLEIFGHEASNLSYEDAKREGFIYNILPITSSLKIISTLYKPFLELEIGLKDNVSLMENMPLIGQELIRVSANKKPIDKEEPEEFTFDFIVTDYPAYGKPTQNINESVYFIKAISDFAYVAAFRSTSRKYTGSLSLEIEKIFRNLGFDVDLRFFIFGQDKKTSKGVLNDNLSTMESIEFLRRNLSDENDFPFYLYQLLSNNPGDVHLSSLSYLLDKEFNKPLYDGKPYVFIQSDVSSHPEGKNAYDIKRRRILELESSLGMSKIKQGIAGAFSSENKYLDWSDKTYITKYYDYDKEIRLDPKQNKEIEDLETIQTPTLGGKSVLSKEFNISGLTLNELPIAKTRYLSVNRDSFSGSVNYGSQLSTHLPKSSAMNVLLQTQTHDIKLAGDVNLNPGNLINIEIPKSKAPDNSTEVRDEFISGTYLITSVAHRVDDDGYYCFLKIKRDSFSKSVVTT